MATILIADDEKEMQKIIVDFMTHGGHSCITADNGIEAITILKNNHIDFIILDIMMPHLDGFAVCKLAREMYGVPIIFLTAKGKDEDKLKGYEYGADDYITKPFNPELLLAKVNVLLRRSFYSNPMDILSSGEIVLQLSSHSVTVSGIEIELTYKEFELLHCFLENKNQVFSRNQLLNRIWGYDYEGNTRTVDSHIKTLRQKLGDEGKHIVTLIRSGYKFEEKL